MMKIIEYFCDHCGEKLKDITEAVKFDINADEYILCKVPCEKELQAFFKPSKNPKSQAW